MGHLCLEPPRTGPGQCAPDLPELGGGRGEVPAPSLHLGSGAGPGRPPCRVSGVLWRGQGTCTHSSPAGGKAGIWVVDAIQRHPRDQGYGTRHWNRVCLPDFWAVCPHLSLGALLGAKSSGSSKPGRWMYRAPTMCLARRQMLFGVREKKQA